MAGGLREQAEVHYGRGPVQPAIRLHQKLWPLAVIRSGCSPFVLHDARVLVAYHTYLNQKGLPKPQKPHKFTAQKPFDVGSDQVGWDWTYTASRYE